MHTVHVPIKTMDTYYSYATISIIFDRYHYDKSVKIIDNFFDSLQINKQTDHKVKEIPYYELLSVVDTSTRYLYTGSVTTPPCD